MTNYENDIQVITKNGAEGELTQVGINNGEIENVNTTTPPSEANELNPLAESVTTGQKNIISVDEASSVSSGNNIYINQDNKLMQIDYDTLATAILNKLSTQSFNSLNTSSKSVLDAINELNSNSAGESGTWTPELTASVTITQGECVYYKIGKFVWCRVSIWIDVTQATSENFYVTMPFNSIYSRVYGTIGYLYGATSFPNACVGIINPGDNKAGIYYGTDGGMLQAKGNQLSTALQFTIMYVTS